MTEGRHRIGRILLAVALVSAVWASGLWASLGWAGAPVRLGYAEFPPFTYTDSEGHPQGSLIAMVSKVAADAGIDLTIQSIPAGQLFAGIADGSVHLFLGVTTPAEFQGTTLISDSVIGQIELDAYAMDQAPAVAQPEDLVGRTVVVLRGYSYGGWRPFLMDPAHRITLIEVDSAEQGLALLRNRSAPLFLEYTLPMKLALAGRFLPDLKAARISLVDAHFVVSRTAPESAALLARLEASFQRLRDAGTLP